MNVHALDQEADIAAFMQEQDKETRARRAKLKYPVRTIQELSFLPKPKNWLVKGLLAQGETSAWIAPPGGMKSALMAELTMCVANQHHWHGRKVDHCFGVVYFALERSDLVHRRLMAHSIRMELSQDDRDQMAVLICPGMVDLTAADCVPHVLQSIRELSQEYGVGPGLLIFDTFAKLIAAGGGDEDKAKDQGRVFANIQRIKDACHGPHVALVGHTGKDETRGSRGSNAFLGDVDVMVTISGAEIKTATVVKANDMAEGPLFSFKSIVHEFGLDEDGDPITVNIVSPEDITAEPTRRASKWTKGLKLVHDAITEAILSSGQDHQVCGTGPIVKAVSVQQARAIHNQRYVSNGEGDRFEAERKAWTRNFKQARELNLLGGELREGQELIWLAQ
ncbi:AAA family ATPase [Bradyrhizobium japonicum]|uniref:AAA family ATPase n=1 Tax=Bradyrhizobium japonicum TaxID=375 RepID=UPI001BA54280|nr:AAA family ATPase [Bradyrhizobium japonicum]MBR0764216.1 AAA family ATPase [Bradyrhizobium japonicum]